MTSILRRPSQIPVRVKYLLTVADISGISGEMISQADCFADSPQSYSPYSVIDDFMLEESMIVELFTGALLKDLGRTLVIKDAITNDHLAIFRHVQIQQGAESEGVGGSTADGWGSIWVKVWAADGTGVGVVRTG
jgi:hypothetical protein